MKQENDEKYNVKAATRCFEILDYAANQCGPVSIQDVCKALDTNSNMAFRLLATLKNSGYMTKDDNTNLYSISLKSLKLSRRALQSLEIRKLTMPYLELIWNKYPKANVNMGVFYDGEIQILDRIDTVSIPRTYFTPGRQLPFHCTGLGKVLTCNLPEEDIDNLIKEKGLTQYTTNTITSRDALLRELAKVKAEGVGRDRNEFINNDNCSAVPVVDGHGITKAAISVSALTNNMSVEEVESAIPLLKDIAGRISYMMGYNSGI
jgi:DNA-binding IclR family transcriptional regulator